MRKNYYDAFVENHLLPRLRELWSEWYGSKPFPDSVDIRMTHRPPAAVQVFVTARNYKENNDG